MSGSLAAAIGMFAMTGPVLADCGPVLDDMNYLKEQLELCDTYNLGATAIWQHRKDASCTVNTKLVDSLDAAHKSPPKGKGENKSGSKDEDTFRKGAINELLRGNYADAEMHMLAFIDGIIAAKPLDDSDSRPGEYLGIAEEIVAKINETDGGCYVW